MADRGRARSNSKRWNEKKENGGELMYRERLKVLSKSMRSGAKRSRGNSFSGGDLKGGLPSSRQIQVGAHLILRDLRHEGRLRRSWSEKKSAVPIRDYPFKRGQRGKETRRGLGDLRLGGEKPDFFHAGKSGRGAEFPCLIFSGE